MKVKDFKKKISILDDEDKILKNIAILDMRVKDYLHKQKVINIAKRINKNYNYKSKNF